MSENNKYIIVSNKRVYKTPNAPKIEDYYDTNESEKERLERLYLYSEVYDNG